MRACLRSAEFYFSSPRRQSDRCPLRPFLGHCGTFTSGASPRSLLFPPAFPGGIPDLEAVRCAVGHCDGGAADLPGLFSCAVVCLFVCVCADVVPPDSPSRRLRGLSLSLSQCPAHFSARVMHYYSFRQSFWRRAARLSNTLPVGPRDPPRLRSLCLRKGERRAGQCTTGAVISALLLPQTGRSRWPRDMRQREDPPFPFPCTLF